MRTNHHNIRLTADATDILTQDRAYFVLVENGEERIIRFHDYAELYRRKGLYEQLYYDRLKCCSPEKVVSILDSVLRENMVPMTQLRVLDLGAGNGMVGELLYEKGVARVVGLDICREAYEAAERDRPAVYDGYYVADIAQAEPGLLRDLATWNLDCLMSVAALGFGDIPPAAFAAAFNQIRIGGWICFNIKETFLQSTDTSGFSTLIKQMIDRDVLRVHHLERYRHRISINGRPLFYFAIVGRKETHLPDDWLASLKN